MNEDAFLSDIRAHPDDDTPRLVLADWLDDQGQAERGELIRTQVELAALPDRLSSAERRADLEGKEFRLLGRAGRGAAGRWLRRTLREATLGFPAWELRRGLVEGVTLPSSQFSKIAADLFARHPIRQVRLTTLEALASVPTSSFLDGLTGLGLFGDLGEHGAHLRELLQPGRVPHLRALACGAYCSRASVLNALSRCPALRELTSLRLRAVYSDNGDRGLTQFLASLPCEKLTELALDWPVYATSILTLLANSPFAGQLRALSLDRVHSAALPAHPGPLLSSLRSLRLRGCNFSQQANLNALLSAPDLARLLVLDLSEVSAFEPLRAEVLTARHLSRLTVLLLANQRLGDAGVAKLAAAPNLAHLTELSLAHNDVTATGARAITSSPFFSRLRKLGLRGNALGPSGAWNLLAAPFLPQLWWLDLCRTGLNDAVALELIVRAPDFPNLAWLDLRGNPLSKVVRERLRAAFGPAVRYDAR